MSILKKRKKAEQESGSMEPKSLSVAYNMHKRNKGASMAQGGMVEEDSESRPSSITEAILRKQRINSKATEPLVDIYDDLNELAVDEDFSESTDMDQPEDSNLHGDDIDSDPRDRISMIRKKLTAKRGQ